MADLHIAVGTQAVSVTGERIMTDYSGEYPNLRNAQYLHQDQLMWGRTQLLIAAQVAVLGGAFALRENQLGYAIGVLVLGCLLTLATLRLVYLDETVRNCIGDKLPRELRMRTDELGIRSRAWLPGGGAVLKWTLWVFAAIDFGLMVTVILQ
jgi:hypothetical protein